MPEAAVPEEASLTSTAEKMRATIQGRVGELWEELAQYRRSADVILNEIRLLEKGFGLDRSPDPLDSPEEPVPARRRTPTRRKRRPPRLRDGERRVIGRQAGDLSKVSVTAFRADSETPWVILSIGGQDIYLEDCFADELALRIDAALAVLPTSK